eukprot:14747674-Ditylum_brightwellii.AAC.1
MVARVDFRGDCKVCSLSCTMVQRMLLQMEALMQSAKPNESNSTSHSTVRNSPMEMRSTTSNREGVIFSMPKM